MFSIISWKPLIWFRRDATFGHRPSPQDHSVHSANFDLICFRVVALGASRQQPNTTKIRNCLSYKQLQDATAWRFWKMTRPRIWFVRILLGTWIFPWHAQHKRWNESFSLAATQTSKLPHPRRQCCCCCCFKSSWSSSKKTCLVRIIWSCQKCMCHCLSLHVGKTCHVFNKIKTFICKQISRLNN